LIALTSVTVNNRKDAVNANDRFALGDSKDIRSIQYSTTHRNMDAGIAKRVHCFPLNKPHRSRPPTTAQPAPVMDRYSGLRRAPNSFRTSHQRRAAKNRIAPHTDKLNTSHSSRVTPKGRLLGMD